MKTCRSTTAYGVGYICCCLIDEHRGGHESESGSSWHNPFPGIEDRTVIARQDLLSDTSSARHDLDRARAEIERLTAERDRARRLHTTVSEHSIREEHIARAEIARLRGCLESEVTQRVHAEERLAVALAVSRGIDRGES